MNSFIHSGYWDGGPAGKLHLPPLLVDEIDQEMFELFKWSYYSSTHSLKQRM